MLSPTPCAGDLVAINSDLDSGFTLFPFLLPGEEQDYLGIGWQYPKLEIHFFCNGIHALPTKPWVNLQTKQSLPAYIPSQSYLYLISHLSDSQLLVLLLQVFHLILLHSTLLLYNYLPSPTVFLIYRHEPNVLRVFNFTN